MEAVCAEFISKTRHLRNRTCGKKDSTSRTVSELTRFTYKLNENHLQGDPTEVTSSENVNPFRISVSPGDVRGSENHNGVTFPEDFTIFG